MITTTSFVKRTFADGARVYADNVELLARVGLRRPVAYVTAGSVTLIAAAAIALAFEGMSTIPLLCLSLSLPGFAWGVRYLMRRPVSYVESLGYVLYCDVVITTGLFVVTTTGVAFLKLAWLVATASYVCVYHGRVAMSVQGAVMTLALAIAVTGGALRGDVSTGVLVTGAATLVLALLITGWVVYAGKKQFALHAASAAQLARLDELTGLLNRRGLTQDCRRWSGAMTVAVVDLDGFKQLNDTQGHAAGDELLRRVARGLQAAAGPDALVARLGGDEFAVVAERLPADLGERLFDPSETPVRASVGLARGIADGASVLGSLLEEADRAMYEAKRAHGSRVA
ncbi:diguanylate cyclase/phosphodiesterase [Tsukamurella pulmonis]|uniref:GGDEF domain-containing protein n=1 Tax=Tsukamurella pulmonis TaxID=47312 RepID=UPI001EDD5DBD|nr:GGDEF domain-containing protein [Tsukamurella pulmonis]BDD81193.1 diguanylate cyclase/phosphodiesterase [Tsukamurella pulmonis]